MKIKQTYVSPQCVTMALRMDKGILTASNLVLMFGDNDQLSMEDNFQWDN